MSELEKLVHASYEGLLSIDDEGAIYDDPHHLISKLSPRIVDESTLSAIDLSDLFTAVNYTQTKTGAATLFRSLVEPLDSLELISEKQNSLRELENGKKKRDALNDYLNLLARREPYMHRYLFQCAYCQNEPHNLRFVDQYKLYRESTEFFKNMVDGVKGLPLLESRYIGVLVSDIQNIDGKRVLDLIKGPVYRTFRGLKTRNEVRMFTPRVKFTLRSLKPTLAIPYVALFSLLLLPPSFQFLGALGPIAYTPIMYGYPEHFDRKHFVSPLKEIYKEDPNLVRGIESLGKIDELLSFYWYSETMKRNIVLPKVTDASKHYFEAKNVRNPILAKENPDYIPNDVNMDEQRLTIITGANSGGKTTYCKTITQIQLLAQIGCYVPAEEAELSIADKILYQAPMFDSIRDAEGRFGTELKRTKDIFLEATPRSLVVLDELAEATTHEEKMEISYVVLNGFDKIGSNTILVTHNHELASRFLQEGRSQNLQVEFKNKRPTYKLVQGIAKKSHAELIAEKIGFSPKDIDEYLKRKGYAK
jgi:DNA mismatch repair protein MutS